VRFSHERIHQGRGSQPSHAVPESLDDYVPEESPVRVIDVLVDELDLGMLGFKTVPADTGRPGYHPAMMLKLYLYGYMNQVQTSRRLEREAQRNVEVMWLTERLAPDHKTISDFRRDEGLAIQKVCREFVVLCRKAKLFSDAFVAIDGSKFKALNNRDKNFTQAKVQRRLKQIDESIARYLSEMESLDRREDEWAEDKTEHLSDKIEILKGEIAKLKKHEAAMLAAPEKQISLTDPDARSMATSGRGTGLVGYNVQAAVDTKHHLIVAHEVTNVGHDRAQLASMGVAAKEAIGTETLKAVADRGYFKGGELKACEDARIETYLPKPQTSGAQAEGRFGKRDFLYHPDADEYACPAGQRATYRFSREENGKRIRRNWSSACPSCSLKSKCTPSPYRRIVRWEHEAVVERAQARLDTHPEMMRIRRQTVEHPFGTLKAWMGSQHFKMKTLKHVSTEMSLHVLAYNLKRALNLFGTKGLLEMMQAA
jgi:transposase